MEYTEEMDVLAAEHAAIRRAREGALKTINLAQSSRDGGGGDHSRVGPELAAVLMRDVLVNSTRATRLHVSVSDRS